MSKNKNELRFCTIEQTAENEVIIRMTQGFFTISSKRAVKNEDEVFELWQRAKDFNEKEQRRFDRANQ